MSRTYELAWFDISNEELPVKGYTPCYLRIFFNEFDSLGRLVLNERKLDDSERRYDDPLYTYTLDYLMNLKKAGGDYFKIEENEIRGLLAKLTGKTARIDIKSKKNLDEFLISIKTVEVVAASFRVNQDQARKLINLEGRELRGEIGRIAKNRLSYDTVRIIDEFPLIAPNNDKRSFYWKGFLTIPINWPQKKEVVQSKLF